MGNNNQISNYLLYARTDLKGYITDISYGFCNLLGYCQDEIIGKNYNLFRDKFDQSDNTYKELVHTLDKEPTYKKVVKHISKNGNILYLDTTVSKEYDKDKKHIGYITVKTDITASVQFEQKLLLEKENEKLIMLGEMFGNIAHQWRQPLATISSITSGLIFKKEYGLLNDKDLDELLPIITEQVKYLSETIDTFKNYVSNDKQIIHSSIQQLYKNALSILDSSLKNNSITILENIYEEAIEVNYPSGELEQVFINLINNSKDALIANNISNPWIKVDIWKFKDFISIKISDNAGGIDLNVLPRIFEPYYTTKHKSKGTGLGLSICNTIVSRSLDGRINARNQQDGAEFSIELPLKVKLEITQ